MRWYTAAVLLSECHYETVQVIIRYLYTGEIHYICHPGMVARLYVDAGKLQVTELQLYAIDHFRQYLLNSSPGDVQVQYVIALVDGLSGAVKGKEWDQIAFIFEHIFPRSERHRKGLYISRHGKHRRSLG